MSESPNPAPHAERPPIPLDYLAPRDEVQDIHFVAHAIGGCIAVTIAGVPWALANVHYTSATRPLNWQTTNFEWRGPLSCAGISLVLFAASVLSAHRAGWRGFVLGSLCGVGVTLLIE